MGTGLGHARRRLINKIVEQTWNVKDPSTREYSFKDVLYVVQEMFENDGLKFLEAETQNETNRGFYTFRAFIKHLFYRNAANYDSMVLLTSDKGSGKSSAAIMMGREWCRILGIRFDPAKHIAYTNKDVMGAIENLSKFHPIICLTGTTKIPIRFKGKEIKKQIKDLVNMKEYEVLTYNTQTKIYEYKKPKKTIMTNSKAHVYEITLENGKTIRATEDHLFLTKKGYKPLKDLTETDEILFIEQTNLPRKCLQCGKEFVTNRDSKKCCSDKCTRKYYVSQNINKTKIYQNKYRKDNRERLLKKGKEYRENNKELVNERKKKYYSTERAQQIKKDYQKKYWQENKERLKENNKRWIKNNKERHRKHLNERHKIQMKTNPQYKIKRNMRRRVNLALKDQGLIKDKSLTEYIGCSVEFLKQHLTSQFVEGMSWENYGSEWDIDHIKPCASFDLSVIEQNKECFNWKNQQPLWKIDNLKKGAKIVR